MWVVGKPVWSLVNTCHTSERLRDEQLIIKCYTNKAYFIFGWPFVKRFALCYRTVVCPVCPVCLSVTLVYCGDTVGWIKMPLAMEVGLGPGHIVLDGDPLPSPSKKAHSTPTFRPTSIVANGRPSQQLLSSCVLLHRNQKAYYAIMGLY